MLGAKEAYGAWGKVEENDVWDFHGKCSNF